MLKDITLGQYFPGDTLIHRLDPRTKLLCVILYIVALFNAKSVLTYAIVAVVLTVCILISKVHYKALTRGLKPVYIIVAFTAIMNLFFSGGTPVADVWLLRHITYEGIRSAIAMVLRIVMLIMGTFLLTYTTSPISLTDALEHLLSPLKKLKMPIHELAMMMSIALRFIPTLIEETDKIMSAQKARGADFESGNIFQRAKALVPILVPLFISAFRRADELATAMECRCYHGGEGRTALHVLRYKTADYLALVAFLAFTVGIIVLKHLGLCVRETRHFGKRPYTRPPIVRRTFQRPPLTRGLSPKVTGGENGVCQTFCAFVSPSVSLTLATSALHAPVCALGCLVRGRQ